MIYIYIYKTENTVFLRDQSVIKCFSLLPDNYFKVEGAKDALICGNASDAG